METKTSIQNLSFSKTIDISAEKKNCSSIRVLHKNDSSSLSTHVMNCGDIQT